MRPDYAPPAFEARTAPQKRELTPRSGEKRTAAKAKLKAWRALVTYVMARDGHKCRSCKGGLKLDPHHIIWKSAGGQDTKENVAAICRWCHDEIHLHRLSVTGNAEGRLRIRGLVR